MAGEVFTLFARLGIKDDEFNKGIKNASSKGKGLSDGLKKTFKVGAAAIGIATGAVVGLSKAFVSGAKDTADYGDKVDKMSQKIGISAEAYQKWDYVMQRAGGNVDSLKMGMKTLSQQAEKNSDSFQKLGISQEDVANLSKEDLFNKTVQGLSQMKDSTERTALATQLLGRAGADMGPLLNQGSEAIQEQMDIAEKYGMVMSDKAVKASADWNDSLTTLSMTTQGLKNRLMGEFLPSLTEVTNGLSAIFAGDYDKGIEQIASGVENLTSKFTEMMPKVLEIGGEIVLNLATAIVNNLPQLLNTGFEVVMKLAEGIIQQLPTIIRTGIQIILSLAQSLVNALPNLLPAITSVIVEIATMLTEPDMLTQLVDAGIQVNLALMDGLIKAIPQLISAVPTIITNLVKAIIKIAPRLLTAGGQLMQKLAQGIKSAVSSVGVAVGQITSTITTKIGEVLGSVWKWGSDIITNFIDGITTAWNNLKTKVTSIADFFKNILGHSTPKEGPMAHDDRWMPDFMDNLIDGIDKKMPELEMAVNGIAGTMAGDYGYADDYGYTAEGEDVQRFEFSFEEGNAPLLQIARLLFPYMKVVEKERG